MNDLVGVLALQGAYDKHIEMLSRMGVESCKVRTAQELEACSSLIIPGGESTTMSLLIQKFGLYDVLQTFAVSYPVMGVCAGAIMMSDSVDDERVIPLKILPVTILRNHYGRQVHSFSADVELKCDGNGRSFPAHFIRAPGMVARDDKTEILASYNNEAVMLRTDRHMVLSFHPELTGDDRIHRCWLQAFHPSFQRAQ